MLRWQSCLCDWFGHFVHIQKKLFCYHVVLHTPSTGAHCAENSWNPAPFGISASWDFPPTRASFLRKTSMHPTNEPVPFLPTWGNRRVWALVLSWHPLHQAPSPPDFKRPRPQQRGWGLLAPAQSCCHTATCHLASSGCGHSSLDFQPKIYWMEHPNCFLHKNYSSSGLCLGL